MIRTKTTKSLLLAGCAALVLTPTASLTIATKAHAEDTVVRFLVPQWASSRDSRVERQVAFQSVIDSFNDANNGMRVEEVVGTVDQASVAQAIEEGAVDAVWINTQWYAGLMAGERLANLDGYVSADELTDYFDWTLEALRSVDGDLGCLWHDTDTPLVFYDSSVIETPPATWSDVRAIAENVQASTGQYGMSYPIMNWSQFNMGMFNASGGQIVDADGRPVLFEGENGVILADMFNFYAGLFADGLVPAQNAASNHNDHLPAVYAGDVAMFLSNSNANVRSLKPNLPAEEYANWRAAPIPAPDGVEAGNYVAGGWLICPVANADPAVEAAAAAWALHATGPRANRDTNKAGGWLPTRASVYETDPFFSEDIFLQTASQALAAGGWAVPFTPIYPVINNALNTAMSAVASGQASVEAALATAQADVMREFEAMQ
jgi:multiple sugar transport system substrate-binding protein